MIDRIMESQDDRGLSRYGEPATLVLLALMSGPKHGYALMQSIEEEMDFKIGPGTLYGAIAKLLKMGMIRGLESQERAKPYEITDQGRRVIEEYVRRWSPIIKLGQARLA